jgi:hypothetical protein
MFRELSWLSLPSDTMPMVLTSSSIGPPFTLTSDSVCMVNGLASSSTRGTLLWVAMQVESINIVLLKIVHMASIIKYN